jgi:hypothetical protein
MPRGARTDGSAPRTYCVYVIELDAEVCAERSFWCKGRRCGRTPVYVGQTALTPEERFANHLAGRRASRRVRRHGRRLRSDLMLSRELATRSEAESAEAALAEQLADAGYCVSGGR